MIVFDQLNARSGDCAVEYEGIKYSYDHFGRLIHFRQQEIESQCAQWPARVLIDETDPLDHWITTLALAATGISTAAMTSGMPALFAAEKMPIISSRLPRSWVKVTSFRSLQCGELPLPSKPFSFHGARVFFTSGTTGSAKAVELDCENMKSRIDTRLKTYPQTTRLLSLIPYLSTFGYQFQISQWVAGGSVILDRDYGHIFNALNSVRIDYLVGAPNHFRGLVDEIPARKLPKFNHVEEIIVGGGALSVKLYERIRQMFDARVKCQYGATETGTWAVNEISSDRDLDFMGRAVDGTQVSFDELAGKKYIKIRNDHTIESYLGTPDSDHFKDGWFYPGDVMEIDSQDRIRVLGRDADVVNVGGVKIDPRVVDDFLIEQDAVADAACFWIMDDMGYPELWAAVAIKESEDIHRLYAALSEKFAAPFLPKRVMPVTFIPRTYSGKPQRYMMAAKIMALMNSNK